MYFLFDFDFLFLILMCLHTEIQYYIKIHRLNTVTNLETNSGTISTKYEYRETVNEQSIHLSPSHLVPHKSSNTHSLTRALSISLHQELSQPSSWFCLKMLMAVLFDSCSQTCWGISIIFEMIVPHTKARLRLCKDFISLPFQDGS